MAEIPDPSENLGESPGGDRRHSRLLADFLFAGKKRADSALDRLRADNNRRSLGMTEQERGLAEGIDDVQKTVKVWGPVVAANVGAAGAAAAISAVAPESRLWLGDLAGLGLAAGAGIEAGANMLSKMEVSYPRAAEAAKRIAAKHVGRWIMMLSVSGVFGTAIGGLVDNYLMANAAAQMGQSEITWAEGGTPEVQATGGGGEWPDESRFVGSQPPPAGDIGRVGINPADQPSPAGDWTDVAGGATEGNGQPPATELPRLSEDGADFLDQTGHTELTEAQERLTAEAAVDHAAVAEAAEAAGQAMEAQAALESGKTIGELAESSGQVPWNVVREMAGDGLHAGEVTNVVTRALQTGGVDVSNLHEGAISQLVTKVQGLFDSADNALQAFNVDHPYAPRPYEAGGLGAVETVKGLNSPEVQAIRAGNLGDMEAAGNLFRNVLKQVLSP